MGSARHDIIQHEVLKVFLNFILSLVPFALFSLQRPTIVAHNVSTELSLMSALHYGDILVKSFTVFITNVSKVIWEESNMRVGDAPNA